MDPVPFDLFDLVPTEATFELSERPGQVYTLCKWSLRVRTWAEQKYSSAGLKTIFETQQLPQIADMAFFMLKEKAAFKTKDDFLDAIVTIKDQITVIKALLTSVGIGEPEIKKITEDLNNHAKPEEQKKSL